MHIFMEETRESPGRRAESIKQREVTVLLRASGAFSQVLAGRPGMATTRTHFTKRPPRLKTPPLMKTINTMTLLICPMSDIHYNELQVGCPIWWEPEIRSLQAPRQLAWRSRAMVQSLESCSTTGSNGYWMATAIAFI
jgi:hypothetical protein